MKTWFLLIFWELFFREILCFTCWFVLVRTGSLMFSGSLGQKASYMGPFCDQLCKQFLLNILKLFIINPKGTYPLPIYKVTSCQAPNFYNITGSLYLFITLIPQPLFDRRSQRGPYVSFDIFVIIILLTIYILRTYYQSFSLNMVFNFSSDLICHIFNKWRPPKMFHIVSHTIR